MERLIARDVAKLVLGYLHNEGLNEAYDALCKTSPYLQEEYRRIQLGLPSGQLFGTSLVDLLIENIELKDCITRFVGDLSTSIKERLPFTSRAKLLTILSSIDKTTFRLVLKRRRSSTAPDTSPEATQTRDLPGHKQARMSSNTMVIQNEKTPATAKVIPACSLSTIKKASSVSKETSIDESESDNRSEEQFTEVPTIQVLSETILENSEFQNVLVQNINRMLHSPDQPIGSQQNQIACSSNAPAVQADRSYQEQIDTAVENIIKVTEQDPLFHSLIDEIFCNNSDAGNNRKSNASTSTPQKSDEINVSNIKQRLRQRKSTVGPAKNVKTSEIPKSTRKLDLNKIVTVLSNETIPAPVSQIFLVDPTNGTITAQSQLLEQMDTATNTANIGSTSADNYLIGLNNPPQSYQLMGSWQSVVLDDSGTITYTDNPNQQYLEPGSIINFDTIHVTMPPAATNLLEVGQPLNNSVSKIDDEVSEAVKNIPMTSRKPPIQELIESKAETPPVSAQLSDVKNKSMSTPRRTSHIRVLDFNDALPGKVEAVRLRLDDFIDADAPHKTPFTAAGMFCTIPSSAPSNLSQNSAPEATSTTDKQLNDAILKQGSPGTIHFARDIDEDTVVSLELSIPDTPARPKNERNQRQLSARRSSKAETRNQQPVRKSQRRQAAASVVSTASQPVTNVKTVEPEPKKDKKKSTDQLQEWVRLRSENPRDFENRVREQLCSLGKATTYKRAPRKKKKKITKNTSLLQVSMDSKDSSIRTISPNSSLTEEHGQLLADALASAKKNPPEPDSPKAAIADALEHPAISLLVSNVTDKNIRQLPKRTRSIKIRFSPTKSVKKTRPFIKSSKSSIQNASEIQTHHQNDEIITSPMDTINKTLPATSPISHSSNLAKLLETPYKEAASDGIPFTPRFDLPNKSQETPLLKQTRIQSDIMSNIKFSQFPTPSFPITPGSTLTPLSKECSPRSGAYSTRPTDYSSSSSYYRPDESDDVNKNLEVLIRSGRIHDVVPTTTTASVTPTVESKSTQRLHMDTLLNCSDSSGSSSSQSSSSDPSSSAWSSSSDNEEADDNVQNPSDIGLDPTTVVQPAQSELGKHDLQELISILTNSPVDKPQAHASPLTELPTKREIQEKNQVELEKKRSRVISSLKVCPPIEKFKPKGTLVNQKGKLARKQGLSAAVASAQQKPMSYADSTPSTSNSTPPKILATITPSKRKVSTPRKIIRRNQINANSSDKISFITKTDIPALPSSTAELDDKIIEKQKRSEDTIFNTIQTTAITEAKKTNISENINRITKEQSIATNKIVSNNTPKATIMKQDNTGKTTTSRLSQKTRDTLHHCFGDGTLSDSDFNETPVKKTYGYDERCPDVLPALSLMPTPHKVSATLKCLELKSPDKPPGVTHEMSSDKTIPVAVPSSSTKPQLVEELPSVTQACLHPTPKIAVEQNDSSSSETDSDEDPYKECSLSLATETSNNCAYEIVSSSVVDSFQQATSTRKPVIFPILNLHVENDHRVRISVTDDIVLFLAEPTKSTATSKKSKDTKNRIEFASQGNTSSKPSSSDSAAHCKRSAPEVKIKTVQIQKGCVDLVGKRKAKAAASAKCALPDMATSSGVEASKSAQPLLFRDMDINLVLGKIHPSRKK